MADLVTVVGADLGPLQREFERATQLGRTFAHDISAAAAAQKIIPPQIDVAKLRATGADAGRTFVAGMERHLGASDAFAPLVEQARAAHDALFEATRRIDFGDTGAVQAIQAQIAAQREYLQSVNATADQLRDLQAIQERVSRGVAAAATRDAAARAQVRAELQHEIRTLALHGRAVDATSTRAVAAWRQEALAIRQQAQEVGLSREQMLRLDATVRQVEQSFARQAAQAQRTAASVGQIGGIVNTTTGRFTSMGRAGATAAVNITQGLSGVAFGLTSAERGAAKALTAFGGFARFFGPQGLLIAGVAASLGSVVELFRRSREEMEKTAQTFEDEVKRMVRAVDQAGLMRKLQEIEIGDVAGERSPFGGFVGGLQDVRGELAKAQAALAPLQRAFEEMPKRFNRDVAGMDVSPQLRAARQEVARLQAALDGLEAQRQRISAALLDPRPLPAIRGLPPIRIEVEGPTAAQRAAALGDVKALRDAAEATLARLAIGVQLQADPASLERLVSDVRDAHALVTAEIARQGGVLSANVDLLRTHLRLLAETRSVPLPAMPIPTRPNIVGVTPQQIRLELDAARAIAELVRVQQAAAAAAARINAIGASARGLAGVARATRGISREMDALLTGSLGVLDVFEQIQKLRAAQAAAALEDPFKIASGFEKFVAGLPALLSGLGAVGGLLGGLVDSGPSPTALALKSNEEALDRLRAELRNTQATFDSLRRGEAAAQRVAAIANMPPLRMFGAVSIDLARFNQLIRQSGLTLAQLTDLAEQYGITIRDGNKIILPAFQQLADALRTQREIALQWGKGFQAEVDWQQLFNEVNDVMMTPARAWADAIALLGKVDPAAELSRLFAGIDVTTIQGRLDADAILRDIVKRLRLDPGGMMKLLEQSGFASVREFAEWITTADRALDSFTDVVNQAAGALTNIPPGYKIQRLIYDSLAPVQKAIDLAIPPPRPDAGPPAPIAGERGRGPGGRDGATITETFTFTGDVLIDAKDRPIREAFEELKAELRRQAMAKSDALTATREPWRGWM